MIAVVAIVVATTIYLGSDIRAVDSQTAPSSAAETAAAAAPSRLKALWQQGTDVSVGATASAQGIVVTTDEHGIVGRNPDTGRQLWLYSRSNRDLCSVYSSDVGSSTTTAGVRGIIAVYRHGNYCEEVVVLDPQTGARLYQRTTPGAVGGQLVSGGSYAGWLGSDLLDLWRFDLVRTYQYGNQPASPESNSGHTGCTFLDIAIADSQFATIENCPAQGRTLRLAINWDDPNAQGKDGFTQWKSSPRGDVDTGATAVKIIAITQDRVAVLVNAPVPALVVYNFDGTVVSRTPRSIPAAAFGTTGITPRVILDDVQYALLGGTLFASTSTAQSVRVTATPTTTSAALLPTGSTAASKPAVTQEDRQTPSLTWQKSGVIGLPTDVGGNVLYPTSTGIVVANRLEGTPVRTLPVTRAGKPQRVDLRSVGENIVELRGSTVAVLRAMR